MTLEYSASFVVILDIRGSGLLCIILILSQQPAVALGAVTVAGAVATATTNPLTTINYKTLRQLSLL